jgi:hypothetical protein
MGVSPFPSSRGKLFKLMARDVLGRLQHQKIKPKTILKALDQITPKEKKRSERLTRNFREQLLIMKTYL